MSRAAVEAVSYVRLVTDRAEELARFAGEIIGLQAVSAPQGQFLFRSDDRYHSLSLSGEKAGKSSLGIEISDEDALGKVEQALLEEGFPVRRATADECGERFVHCALIAEDGTGNAIDLVVRPTRHGRRFFPPRDCGITGFHDVGIRSKARERDLCFWTNVLGARVSDCVGDIAYLKVDRAHHRVALYPSTGSGLLYMSFAVESLDLVMQNSYFMQQHQVRTVQGPGRQVASGQIFVHFQGPDDMLFSFVTGMNEFDDSERRARRFARTADVLCAWGSECASIPELGGRGKETK